MTADGSLNRRLLGLVGLHPEYMGRYPQAFSGGQQQRLVERYGSRRVFFVDEAMPAA